MRHMTEEHKEKVAQERKLSTICKRLVREMVAASRQGNQQKKLECWEQMKALF